MNWLQQMMARQANKKDIVDDRWYSTHKEDCTASENKEKMREIEYASSIRKKGGEKKMKAAKYVEKERGPSAEHASPHPQEGRNPIVSRDIPYTNSHNHNKGKDHMATAVQKARQTHKQNEVGW